MFVIGLDTSGAQDAGASVAVKACLTRLLSLVTTLFVKQDKCFYPVLSALQIKNQAEDIVTHLSLSQVSDIWVTLHRGSF